MTTTSRRSRRKRLDASLPVRDPELFARALSDLYELSRGFQVVTLRECRLAVRMFYRIQDMRIRAQNQTRAAVTDGYPCEFVRFSTQVLEQLEEITKAILGQFAERYRVGQWLQRQVGIGRILSAALLVTFDVRVGHVGHWYSYAGLVPGVTWSPGQRRPWNAWAKSLVLYRLGECLIKQKNHREAYYGPLYDVAKARYIEKYPTAPRAHVHAMARRWMVKRFLSHLWEVSYEDYYDTDAPDPYPVAILGHSDYTPPPLWPGDYRGLSLRELYGETQRASRRSRQPSQYRVTTTSMERACDNDDREKGSEPRPLMSTL